MKLKSQFLSTIWSQLNHYKRKKEKWKKITKLKTASETKPLERDEIMDIIEDMRNEGATFDRVAKHLIELRQPTFSGRGEWHAQTVHRICNKR